MSWNGVGRRVSTILHRYLTYPAIVVARGEHGVFGNLREFEARQWDAGPSIRSRQLLRLDALLRLAVERSPFYAERIHAKRLANPLTWDDLTSLPTVSKSDLQQAHQRMMCVPGPRRVTRKVTGGSTGQAVTIVKDRSATAAEMAASWLGASWFGIRMGDRAVRFWGVPTSARRKLRFAAADFAMHRIRFSAFAFDEADLERYWARCLRFRPAYFYGYVSMLDEFAAFVERRGLDGRSLNLKVIVTTSEVLSGAQRNLLTRVFGCPVQNEYGCGEVGAIAYECERGGLHVMAENLIVEVLRPDGSAAAVGEVGDVVVTDLNNTALPLIRYRVADLAATAAECACGRGLPVLQGVVGRAYDFIQAPSGRRYHGEFFMYLFEDLRSTGVPFGQFQVVQVDRVTLHVLIVASAGEALKQTVAAMFADRLPEMNVSVSLVDSIQRRPSGKMQVIENRWIVPPPAGVAQ